MTNTRKIGDTEVFPIGLGCMNLSHAYGVPPTEEQAVKLLHTALDLGINHFDTAALYGFGKNEQLLGKALKGHRQNIHLASKCVLGAKDGKRFLDGRPESLLKTIDEALVNLQTDVIDLYYLHRWDKNVPIEDSMGAMVRMIEDGKIRAIGLSEVSVETLKKAHAVHPVTAVQTEYSLWTRNPEIGMLDACKAMGIALVAFSPMTRGFCTGSVPSEESLVDGDIRKNMPRFQGENLKANLKFLEDLKAFSAESGLSLAEICLAWLLKQGEHIVPIPGTTSIDHLKENVGAASITLSDEQCRAIDDIITDQKVAGFRYPPGVQKEIDTEQWEWEKQL